VQLGKRVRAIRERKGLSQEAAATAAHLDAKHFQAIESGRANITFATLFGLARAFEMPMTSLVRGIGGTAK